MSLSPREARFALAVLFGINLMNFFDRQVAGALSEPMRVEFGMSDVHVGLIATVFTLVYATVGVPLGRLTDSWLRTRLIAIGVATWSLFTAASGIAWNTSSFVATRIGVGIGEASCAPASQSLIADIYPPEKRARAMGVFMLGLPLGIFAAYTLAGIIGEKWGWRSAFFLACLPGLLLAVLVMLVREPQRTTPMVVTHQPAAPARTVLRIPTLRWIILSGILFNFQIYAVNIFQTPFLQRFHELGLKDASAISALSLGLTGVVGLLAGGALGDRFGAKRPEGKLLVAAFAMLLGTPCVFFALQLPKGAVLMFTLLMGLSSALTFAYYSTVYSAIQDVVPANMRGTAVSLYFFGMYVLGASFGATIMGALSDHFARAAAAGAELTLAHRASGLHDAMYVMPVLLLLCAGSLFGAARNVRADMARVAGKPQPAPAPTPELLDEGVHASE
ncbi:MAG: MFS transporter [Polyangiales bacterium]